MIEKKSLENLIREVNGLVKHKKEKEILRGEKFNVFSILKMERKENETHSAFLCELLNPKGSHLKGNLFLKLFLSTIENETIDADTAHVKTEHAIGHKNKIDSTGGRIDIYIWDAKGNTLCIENKIDAGDQNQQVERYHNHNAEKNSVYYLTRTGSEPSKLSKGKLIAGEDFYLLSYQTDIVNWLNLCLKESTETPILRETIKQYIILIKKITNTMDNKEQEELIDLILRNYEVSNFVASNLNKAKQKLKENFRKDVLSMLEKEIGDEYLVTPGNEARSINSQIWIKPKVTVNSHLIFGIESFSGENYFTNLIIGIFNKNPKIKPLYTDVEGVVSKTSRWLNVKEFDQYDGTKIHLSNPETILRIHSEEGFREKLVIDVVRQAKEYLKKQTEPLVKFING